MEAPSPRAMEAKNPYSPQTTSEGESRGQLCRRRGCGSKGQRALSLGMLCVCAVLYDSPTPCSPRLPFISVKCKVVKIVFSQGLELAGMGAGRQRSSSRESWVWNWRGKQKLQGKESCPAWEKELEATEVGVLKRLDCSSERGR